MVEYLVDYTKFVCQKCGWCCKETVINVSYTDIVNWFHSARFDILNEVSWINNYPKKVTGGFYIAKTALKPKQTCPFLVDNKCSIHDVKPLACKDAPESLMELKGCPSFKGPYHQMGPLKKNQYQDFKQAHDNRDTLLQLLVESRRQYYGNT